MVDLYLLEKKGYDIELLNAAMVNTFNLRETNYDASYIVSVIDKIYANDRIKFLFENYKSKHVFVKELTFEKCFASIRKVYNDLKFEDKINLNIYNIEIHLLKCEDCYENDKGYASNNKLNISSVEQINQLLTGLENDYDLLILDNSYFNVELVKKLESSLCPNIIINSILSRNSKKINVETSIEFYNKIIYEFNNILEKYKNKKILIFTNSEVITVIKCIINGFPYSNKLKISPEYEKIVKLK